MITDIINRTATIVQAIIDVEINNFSMSIPLVFGMSTDPVPSNEDSKVVVVSSDIFIVLLRNRIHC